MSAQYSSSMYLFFKGISVCCDIILQLLMIEQKNPLISPMDFGPVLESKFPRHLKLLDLDKGVKDIYYHDEKETIQKLMKYYEEKTSYKGKVFFVEAQNGRLAKPEESIKFYVANKPANEIIFKVCLEPPVDAPHYSMIRLNIKLFGQKEEVELSSEKKVEDLIELLCSKGKVTKQQISLFYKGSRLEPQYTLEKYNIQNNDEIHCIYKVNPACFAPDTLVLCPLPDGNSAYKPIHSLTPGQSVLAFKQGGKLVQEQVLSVQKTLCSEFISVCLSNGVRLECTGDHQFLCSDGKWRMHESRGRDGGESRLEVGSELVDVGSGDEGKASVMSITYCSGGAEYFYHPTIKNTHNFIVRGIVAHNAEITIKLHWNNKSVNIAYYPAMLVGEIKSKISEQEGTDASKITIYFGATKLSEQKSLIDYNITKGSSLNAVIKNKIVPAVQAKRVLLQTYQGEVYKFPFSEYQDKTAKEIVEAFRENPGPNFCLLFGDFLILPSQKLSTIREHPNFSQFGDLSIKVLSSGGKYLFSKLLTGSKFNAQLYNVSEFRAKIEAKVNELNSEDVEPLMAVTYFSTGQFTEPLEKFISEFVQTNLSGTREHLFCDSLIHEMKMLPPVYKDVYRIQPNFKLSNHYLEGDLFTLSNFTSFELRKEAMASRISAGCTFYQAKSVTGRDISRYSVRNEEKVVVFFPFTYFVVDRIVKTGDYQIVELTELASPVLFAKNMIVWVDDYPENNLAAIQKISSNVEVIQLRSTHHARRWIEEFGWFLHQKDIQFKFISDMVRVESGQDNYLAGIDLVQLFYDHKGFTTPILIYCRDKSAAEKNIEERVEQKDRVLKVTMEFRDIIRYCSDF